MANVPAVRVDLVGRRPCHSAPWHRPSRRGGIAEALEGGALGKIGTDPAGLEPLDGRVEVVLDLGNDASTWAPADAVRSDAT